MSEERPGAGYEALLAPLERTTWRFYLLIAILLTVIGVGVFAYIRQVSLGLGVTGMNRPIFWGVYITNFVFFIGLSHAGTLISAILRIVGAEWRRPFTRLAEAVTVFSLPFGVGSILIDLGRIDRIFNVIRYARFQSPMLWDVTAARYRGRLRPEPPPSPPPPLRARGRSAGVRPWNRSRTPDDGDA